MKNKYFIREMPCYTKTTLEQRKKIPPGAYFPLKALPTEGLRTEFYEFLKKRGKEVEATTMYSEVWRYDAVSAFLSKRAKRVQSLQEREPEVWLRQLRAWMLEEGYRLTVSAVSEYGKEKVLPSTVIRYFRMVICDRSPEDEREETEKDVWRLDKLDIPIKENLIRNDMTLNFTRIPQEKIRAEAKKGIYLNLRSEAIDTIRKEIHAIQRFAGYLEEKQPRVQSCQQIDRNLLEEYLVWFRTEIQKKDYRAELTRLRSILDSIGKVYGYRQLQLLFLNTDIPSTPQAEFRTYTDWEIQKFNAAVAKLDIQIARLLVIHQMLGTRISDTLTLWTDCLFEQKQVPMIRIRQMKTNTYIKPISQELKELIELAIAETKKRYGETKYIFVREEDPTKPMKYGTLQNKIMAMIQKEQLKDGNGKLFGFNTHMFRHYYGSKITEMDLDDWTLAKLFGHRSIKSVKYYRRMSNHRLAEDTRAVREQKSRIIAEHLEGWGEEYEQVR